MSSKHETIVVSVDDDVGHIRLNRPNVLNALSTLLMKETTEALSALSCDKSVRAIVLSAEGRAFSSGFDLKESGTKKREGTADWKPVIEADFEFIMQFWECPKPTVAAVQGFCLAGGMELALACDMCVASENALFGEPEVRFGSGIVAMLMPWLTSPKFAKELLLTGNDRIPASRILQMGLINEVTPEGEQLARAVALAKQVATSSAFSVQLTKQALNRSYDIRGMRSALQGAVDTAIIIESALGPERAEFNRIRAEHGLRAAIEWRDKRFRAQF
nr:enoyl-CoA hydratase/isomerase family protein [Mesorhizobium sp. WSM4875]